MIHSKNTGFTLIEVLIVIVIIGIITAIATLSFSQFGRAHREKIVLDQFVTAFHAAEQQAIFTPETLKLSITSKGYTYLVYRHDSTGEMSWVPLNQPGFSRPKAFSGIFEVNLMSQIAEAPLLLSPSSDVTPFILQLKGNVQEYTITVRNNGSIEVQTHEKK